jgi:hypothetical protein
MKRNATAVALTAIVIMVATGCTTFNLDAPADRSAVRQGAGVPVQMRGSPRIVRNSVTVDGQVPGTGTVPCSSDTQCSGVLPGVSPGDHVIAVTAEVTCWYCTPNPTTFSASRSVCLGNDPAALNSVASTAAAKSSGRLWSNTSDTGATTAMSTAGSATDHQWQFYRVGLSPGGVIRSVANGCLCLQSRVSPSDHSITFARCDLTGQTAAQNWERWPSGTFSNGQTDPNAFRLRNLASYNCITEGANNALTDEACDLSATATAKETQAWIVRSVSMGQVTQPF